MMSRLHYRFKLIIRSLTVINSYTNGKDDPALTALQIASSYSHLRFTRHTSFSPVVSEQTS